MWSGDHRTTIPDVAVELVMSSLRSRRWRRPPNRPRLVEWDLELGSRPPGCLWAGSWCHPGSTKGRQSHFQFWDMRTMTLRPSLLEAHCCPSCHNLKYPGHQTRDATAREATDCSLRCPDQCKEIAASSVVSVCSVCTVVLMMHLPVQFTTEEFFIYFTFQSSA